MDGLAGLKALRAQCARDCAENEQRRVDDCSVDLSLDGDKAVDWMPCSSHDRRDEKATVVPYEQLTCSDDADSCTTTVSYHSKRANLGFPFFGTPYGRMADAWLTFEHFSFLGRFVDETRDDGFLLRSDKSTSRVAKQWKRRRSLQLCSQNPRYRARLRHRWESWYGIRNFAEYSGLIPQQREELRRRCSTLFQEVGFRDDPSLAVEESLAHFLDLVLDRLRHECARLLEETIHCCLDVANCIVAYAEVGYAYVWNEPSSVLYRFRTQLPRFRAYCPLDGHLLFFQAVLVQAYSLAKLTRNDYRFTEVFLHQNTGQYTYVIHAKTAAMVRTRSIVHRHLKHLTFGLCTSTTTIRQSNELTYRFELL